MLSIHKTVHDSRRCLLYCPARYTLILYDSVTVNNTKTKERYNIRVIIIAVRAVDDNATIYRGFQHDLKA